MLVLSILNNIIFNKKMPKFFKIVCLKADHDKKYFNLPQIFCFINFYFKILIIFKDLTMMY